MSQAGGVAVGVPKITLSPLRFAMAMTLSKKEKSYAPSRGSMRCQANSPMRMTLQPSSTMR